MAKLSDLVGVFEAHKVDAVGTLTLFSRRLREAGRVTKAKRGRGAAAMSYLDAARFLIALGATDHPERAIEVENFFSSALPFCLSSNKDQLPPPLAAIALQDLPFDCALAALIEQFVTLPISVRSAVFIDVERAAGGGNIIVGDAELRFLQPKLRAVYTSSAEPNTADEAIAESGRYATGKSIRATFDGSLILALHQSVSGGEND